MAGGENRHRDASSAIARKNEFLYGISILEEENCMKTETSDAGKNI
jgi:hypothetical protein